MSKFFNKIIFRNKELYKIYLGTQIVEDKSCKGIILDKDNITFTTNNSQTLTYVTNPTDTTDNVIWDVSPAGICSVENGTITPIKNGECTIYVYCGKNYTICNVTVNIPMIKPCTGIILDKDNITFTDNNPQTLTYVTNPTDTTDSVIWNVNPSGIIGVNNGVITPIQNGSCTIKVTCGNYSDTCNVTVNIESVSEDYADVLANGIEEPSTLSVEHFFEIPSIFVSDWFETKVNTNTKIEVPIYVGDWEEKNYLYDIEEKFLLEIKRDDTESIIRKIVYAGDSTITLDGFNEIGEHYFTLQVSNLKTGMKSPIETVDLYIIDDSYAITDEQTYTMTSNDLTTYSIDNTNNEDESVRIANSLNITNFLKEKREAGFRKVVMLPGIYRIDPQGSRKNSVVIPSGLTVDGNGCTIKQHVYYSPSGIGESMIVQTEENSFDSHLLNMKIEGDYDVHDFSPRYDDDGNLISGRDGKYEAEGFNGINFGGAFCTMDNVELCEVSSYALGGSGYDRISEIINGNYITNTQTNLQTGENIDSSICFESALIDLTKMSYETGWMNPVNGLSNRFISCGAFGGYFGITGESDIILLSFYNENKEFLEYNKIVQYGKTPIPKDTKYCKATFLGSEGNRNIPGWGCKIYTLNYIGNTSVKITNFYAHDTRSCLTYPVYDRVLFKDCRFERVAKGEGREQLTRWVFDNEDGAYFGRNFYFIDNEVTELVSAGFNMIHGYNSVFKNNINMPVTKWQGRSTLFDNNDSSIEIHHKNTCGSSCHKRIKNQKFNNSGITIKDNDESDFGKYSKYKSKSFAVNCGFDNSVSQSPITDIAGFYKCNTKAGSNFYSTRLNGVFNECEIDLNGKGIIVNGAIKNSEIFNTSSSVNSGSLIGNYKIYNSNLNNINHISNNQTTETAEIYDSTLNNVYSRISYWNPGTNMIFDGCTINCDNTFITRAHYQTYLSSTLNNCIINITNGNVLKYNDDRAWTPSDTSLTTQPFTIKKCNITLDKNSYAIDGLSTTLPANNKVSLALVGNTLVSGLGLYNQTIKNNANITLKES